MPLSLYSKTSTLVALLEELYRQGSSRRLLVTAPTNVAVTNVASRILRGGVVPSPKMALVGDEAQLGVYDQEDGGLDRIFVPSRVKRLRQAQADAMTALETVRGAMDRLRAGIEGDPAVPELSDLDFDRWIGAVIAVRCILNGLEEDVGSVFASAEWNLEGCSRALNAAKESLCGMRRSDPQVLSDACQELTCLCSMIVRSFVGPRQSMDDKKIINQATIVFATVASSARSDMMEVDAFNTIFVDEACQVSLLPLACSTNAGLCQLCDQNGISILAGPRSSYTGGHAGSGPKIGPCG